MESLHSPRDQQKLQFNMKVDINQNHQDNSTDSAKEDNPNNFIKVGYQSPPAETKKLFKSTTANAV